MYTNKHRPIHLCAPHSPSRISSTKVCVDALLHNTKHNQQTGLTQQASHTTVLSQTRSRTHAHSVKPLHLRTTLPCIEINIVGCKIVVHTHIGFSYFSQIANQPLIVLSSGQNSLCSRSGEVGKDRGETHVRWAAKGNKEGVCGKLLCG